MKCLICHSPNIEKRKVEEEIRIKNDLVLTPVEVMVCLECGERYYDRKTMKLLEEIREKVTSKKAELHKIGSVLEYRELT